MKHHKGNQYETIINFDNRVFQWEVTRNINTGAYFLLRIATTGQRYTWMMKSTFSELQKESERIYSVSIPTPRKETP